MGARFFADLDRAGYELRWTDAEQVRHAFVWLGRLVAYLSAPERVS